VKLDLAAGFKNLNDDYDEFGWGLPPPHLLPQDADDVLNQS
jgi:hypothetical protein